MSSSSLANVDVQAIAEVRVAAELDAQPASHHFPEAS